MATVTQPQPAAKLIPSSSGVVFGGVSWADYEAMLKIVGDRPIRVTYDRGTMEVSMPSFGHEDDAHLLGRIVDTLADQGDIPVKSGRTTTHKRKDLDRGTEPDQCYWFRENARKMVGKRQLDLSVDSPPDLIIEVDVASNSLKRLPLFAAMGVSEVWRLAECSLEFLHLQPDRTYQVSELSRNFPTVAATEVSRFLEEGRSVEETAWVRSFRAYVQQIAKP